MSRDLQRLEAAVANLSWVIGSLFLVVLGAINLVHNLTALFRNPSGPWWPIVPGIVLFGLLPLAVGCFLLLRKEPDAPS